MHRVTRCFKGLRRFRRDKSGVAAVEFALLAPFLMMAALFMFDFSTMAFDKMKLTSGVRSASQYVLSGGGDDDVIKQLVIDGSGLALSAGDIDITPYCNCTGSDATVSCFSSCGADMDTPRTYKRISAIVPDSATSRILFRSTNQDQKTFGLSIANTSASVEVRTR